MVRIERAKEKLRLKVYGPLSLTSFDESKCNLIYPFEELIKVITKKDRMSHLTILDL